MSMGIGKRLTGSTGCHVSHLFHSGLLGRAIGPWCTLWEMLPYDSSLSLLFCLPPVSGDTPAFSPCGLGRQWTKCPWSPALGRGWVHDQEVPLGLSSFPWQGTELEGHRESGWRQPYSSLHDMSDHDNSVAYSRAPYSEGEKP